jgi:hypothetical protein
MARWVGHTINPVPENSSRRLQQDIPNRKIYDRNAEQTRAYQSIEYAATMKLLYRGSVKLPPHSRDPHGQMEDTRIPFRPVVIKRVVAILQFGRATPFPIGMDFHFSGTHGAYVLPAFALGDMQAPAIPSL